jgi:hypothetical protein
MRPRTNVGPMIVPGVKSELTRIGVLMSVIVVIMAALKFATPLG